MCACRWFLSQIIIFGWHGETRMAPAVLYEPSLYCWHAQLPIQCLYWTNNINMGPKSNPYGSDAHFNASKVYRLGTTSVYESSAEQTTPTLSHPSPLYCSFLSRVLFFFYLMPLLIFYPSPYPASFPSISLFFLFLIPLLILPLSHPSSSSFSSFF